jgi:hypothetical protein
MRLIHGRLCVSCQNRAYEWRKGKNAKGAFPKQHPKLGAASLSYLVGGKVCTIRREAPSALELAVEVLRDSEKRAVFGMGAKRAAG